MRKELLVIGLVLALGLGAYLALLPTEAEVAERLRHVQAQNAVAETRAAALTPFVVAGGGLALAAVGGGLAGAAYYGVAQLRRRSQLIYADRHGIFPQMRIAVAGQVIVHDPNRQPAPTTVYAPDGRGGVAVTPVILPELLDATRAAVAQAATVQAIRAGVSGSAGLLPEHVQRTAQRLFPAGGDLPQVRIVGDDIPGGAQYAALLAEARRSEGGDDELDEPDAAA